MTEKAIKTTRDAVEFFPFNFVEHPDINWDEVYEHWIKYVKEMKKEGVIDGKGEFR